MTAVEVVCHRRHHHHRHHHHGHSRRRQLLVLFFIPMAVSYFMFIALGTFYSRVLEHLKSLVLSVANLLSFFHQRKEI